MEVLLKEFEEVPVRFEDERTSMVNHLVTSNGVRIAGAWCHLITIMVLL